MNLAAAVAAVRILDGTGFLRSRASIGVCSVRGMIAARIAVPIAAPISYPPCDARDNRHWDRRSRWAPLVAGGQGNSGSKSPVSERLECA